jgi:hypothetical protein
MAPSTRTRGPERKSSLDRDPLAPDERRRDPGEVKRTSARLRNAQRVFAALALAFFCVPAAVWIAGFRSGLLPGEQPAGAPRVAQGWRFFDAATRYVEGRFPGRQAAIHANTWISENVFDAAPRYGAGAFASSKDRAIPFGGTTPSRSGSAEAQTGGAQAGHAPVAEGLRGWLYLQAEFDVMCQPPIGLGEALKRWERLVQLVHASGRRVVLVVTPDKATIYPENVAPSTINWRCAQRNKARLWSMLEALRNPDIVPLRREVLALKRRARSPLYPPTDSHWNDTTGLLVLREALRRVGGPVQVQDREVHPGTARVQGDLARLLGRAGGRLSVPKPTIVRPAGAPMIPGQTLLLHDSFGWTTLATLPRYAQHMRRIPWIAASPRAVVAGIRSANTVVIEVLERDFVVRAADKLPDGRPGVVTPSLLRTLSSPGSL